MEFTSNEDKETFRLKLTKDELYQLDEVLARSSWWFATKPEFSDLTELYKKIEQYINEH